MAEKYRGFKAVSRLKKEGIKPLYPQRNDSGSCGYDFRYPYKEPTVINPGETKMIKTGIKAYMQKNEVLLLNVRSGVGIKKGIYLPNNQGWIDSTYFNNENNEGEIIFALKNNGTEPFEIKYGDKFGQGMFINYLVADYDDIVNNKRIGGLGSSGR